METIDSQGAKRPAAQDLLARARAIVPMLKSRAEMTERNRRVSTETIEAAREAELFKLLQPRRFGGFEYGYSEFIDINFEIGQGCGSSGWCISLAMMHQWFVALFPLEGQQEVWDVPGTIVAGSYIPLGKAEAVDGGHMLTGMWPFTSNCDNADYFLLGVMYPPVEEGGKPRPGFALLPKADVTIVDDWFSVGLAGTGSKTVAVTEPTLVPAHRQLLVADMAVGTAPGAIANPNPLYTLPFFAVVPSCLTSPALAIVQGAIEDFLDWIGSRATLGSVVGGGVRMAQFSHVQSRIAEAAAGIDAGMTLLHRDLLETQKLAHMRMPIDVGHRIRNRRDQAFAARLAVQSVNALFDAVGAGGLHLSSSVQRAWRDVNAIARHASLNWDAVSTMYGQHRFGLEPQGQY